MIDFADIAVKLTLLVTFVAVPLNWIVAILLWRLSLSSRGARVLRDRAIAATAVAITATVLTLVFLNNDQVPPPLDLLATHIVTRIAIFAMSIVPALFWLRLYRRDATPSDNTRLDRLEQAVHEGSDAATAAAERAEQAVRDSTAKVQEGTDAANAAYVAANDVNLKIKDLHDHMDSEVKRTDAHQVVQDDRIDHVEQGTKPSSKP